MNERIRKLVLKAIYDVDHIYHPVDNPLNEEVSKMYIPDCFAEKFAELIVRECISQCEFVANMATITNSGEMSRKTKATADSCSTMIKQHFGVEE
jgi:hypothetical protein